jgi:hypothetical protein
MKLGTLSGSPFTSRLTSPYTYGCILCSALKLLRWQMRNRLQHPGVRELSARSGFVWSGLVRLNLRQFRGVKDSCSNLVADLLRPNCHVPLINSGLKITSNL